MYHYAADKDSARRLCLCGDGEGKSYSELSAQVCCEPKAALKSDVYLKVKILNCTISIYWRSKYFSQFLILKCISKIENAQLAFMLQRFQSSPSKYIHNVHNLWPVLEINLKTNNKYYDKNECTKMSS